MSANLKIHKLEFRDAPEVFDGSTVTYEDDRFNYGEQRFVTLGLLKGTAVSIVHTETPEQSALSLLERRHDMKKRTSSKVSKTDWKRLRAMKEHQIKLSKAHPQLDITRVSDACA